MYVPKGNENMRIRELRHESWSKTFDFIVLNLIKYMAKHRPKSFSIVWMGHARLNSNTMGPKKISAPVRIMIDIVIFNIKSILLMASCFYADILFNGHWCFYAYGNKARVLVNRSMTQPLIFISHIRHAVTAQIPDKTLLIFIYRTANNEQCTITKRHIFNIVSENVSLNSQIHHKFDWFCFFVDIVPWSGANINIHKTKNLQI